MGKKKKDYDPERYKIVEMIDTISEAENSNWGKFIVKASMDDKPATIDIRNIKLGDKKIIGKGVSLTDAETDAMVNALISRGYGSPKVLEKEMKRRKKMYGFIKDDDEEVHTSKRFERLLKVKLGR